MLLGIDPGNTKSGYCVVYAGRYEIITADKVDNEQLSYLIYWQLIGLEAIIIEQMQYHNKRPVGRETFETAYWIGEFRRIAKDKGIPCYLYAKSEYAKKICGTRKYGDTEIWASLKIRFGGAKKGEPLYMLRGETDKRSAYGLIVYHNDKNNLGKGYSSISSSWPGGINEPGN